MNTKALFLDLDGTLLNDKKEITEGNYNAIHAALTKGHKVIINTGRPLVSAIKQAQRLGLTEEGCYLVAFNGGILYDMGAGKILFKKDLPLDIVFEVFDEANARNLHVQTYDDTYVIVEKRNDNDIVRRYCGNILMEHQVTEDIRTVTGRPVKVLAIDFENRKAVEDFQEWIREKYSKVLDCFFSCPYYLEIVPCGLNKGTALRQMSELLGIPLENTVAAGDEANDIEMIKTAGIGVSMKNGTEDAKAAADYVTTRDNNNDGIAEIIEKFILLQ